MPPRQQTVLLPRNLSPHHGAMNDGWGWRTGGLLWILTASGCFETVPDVHLSVDTESQDEGDASEDAADGTSPPGDGSTEGEDPADGGSSGGEGSADEGHNESDDHGDGVDGEEGSDDGGESSGEENGDAEETDGGSDASEDDDAGDTGSTNEDDGADGNGTGDTGSGNDGSGDDDPTGDDGPTDDDGSSSDGPGTDTDSPPDDTCCDGLVCGMDCAMSCGACAGYCSVDQTVCGSTFGYATAFANQFQVTGGYILGYRIDVSNAPLTLSRLGIIGGASANGTNVRLGVYDTIEDAGVLYPNNLIVATPDIPLTPGRHELPVEGSILTDGSYWLLVAVSADNSHATSDSGSNPGIWYAIPYGMPTTLGPTAGSSRDTGYTPPNFNWYAVYE